MAWGGGGVEPKGQPVDTNDYRLVSSSLPLALSPEIRSLVLESDVRGGLYCKWDSLQKVPSFYGITN
jgi:hypothetical protein